MLYPVKSPWSAVLVIEIDRKTTLCGRSIPRHWEYEFEGQAFPEIGEFEQVNKATLGEGFYIGRWFCGHYKFCPTCYSKLKQIKCDTTNHGSTPEQPK